MNSNQNLIRIDAVERALAEAQTIDEIQDLWKKLAAIKKYFRNDREQYVKWAEAMLRTTRKGGTVLKKMKENGQRHKQGGDRKSNLQTASLKLEELGIEYTQSSRWQAIAGIPQDIFEATIDRVKADEETELTTALMLKVAQEIQRASQSGRRREVELEESASGLYSVILADPPWQYSNSGFNGAAEDHYPTLPTEAICTEPVNEYAATNAVLFLWVTNPLLPDGLTVLSAWGFEYKTNFVWVKNRANYGKLGFYNYGRHELLLLGIKGTYLPARDELPESVLAVPKAEHSRKPKEAYELIEAMYPEARRLELYARQTRDGWDSFGNEVQS